MFQSNRESPWWIKPRTGRNKKIVIRHFHLIDEQMRGNDKLFSIELAFILLAYWNIEVSGEYCTKEIGLDLEWGKLLQIDLLIMSFTLRFGFYLYKFRTLDKGYTLNYSSNKTSTTCFNNPVNRSIFGSDKSQLTSKVDCPSSDALSDGKIYCHTSIRIHRLFARFPWGSEA